MKHLDRCGNIVTPEEVEKFLESFATSSSRSVFTQVFARGPWAGWSVGETLAHLLWNDPEVASRYSTAALRNAYSRFSKEGKQLLVPRLAKEQQQRLIGGDDAY